MRIKRLGNRTDVIVNRGAGKIVECFSYEDQLTRLTYTRVGMVWGWIYYETNKTLSVASQQHLQAFKDEYAEEIESARKGAL